MKRLLKLFQLVPVLAGPLLIYSFFVAVSGPNLHEWMLRQAFSATTAGDAILVVTYSDLGEWICTALLYAELMKSLSRRETVFLDHLLSLFLLLVIFAEVLLWPGFASSFSISLCLLALIDVAAGFAITAISARRDVMVSGGGN